MDRAIIREQYFAAWTKLNGTKNSQEDQPNKANLISLEKRNGFAHKVKPKPLNRSLLLLTPPVLNTQADPKQREEFEKFFVQSVLKASKQLEELDSLAQQAQVIENKKIVLSMHDLLAKKGIAPGDTESPFLLKHAFYSFMCEHAQHQCRTYKKMLYSFVKHFKDLADRPLNEITLGMVRQWHLALGTKISGTHANRQVALLQSIYSRMYEWELYSGRNPAKGVKKFPEKSRDRFLNQQEVNRVLEVLPQIKSTTFQDYVRLSLYTVRRQGDVMSMKWADIDLVNRIWTVPRTKNGDSHTIPLLPEAMEVLERRKKFSRSTYVLTSKMGVEHYTCPRGAWKRLKQFTGIHDIRPHDLRRTLASWQSIGGTSIPIIAATLGHRSWASTQVYARLNLQPVRDSMIQAAKAMRGE